MGDSSHSIAVVGEKTEKQSGMGTREDSIEGRGERPWRHVRSLYGTEYIDVGQGDR